MLTGEENENDTKGSTYMEFIDYEQYGDNNGIYIITNTVNGKQYIGQTTKTFKRRYWHHKWCLENKCHCNSHLQKAWNKYGAQSFTFKVLKIINNNEDIDELEKYYIAQYNTIITGYNIQSGGQPENLHKYRNPDSYKAVGELNRERMTGTKLSAKTKSKMSMARKGEKNQAAKLSNDDVIKIKHMIADGVSDRDIAKQFNVTHKNIGMIRRGTTWKHIKI